MRIPRKKTVKFHGVAVTLYSIGWLSYLTGRSEWTVRHWEKNGLLPQPIFNVKSSKQWRWYSAQELVGYAMLYKRADVKTGESTGTMHFKHSVHTYKTQLEKKIAKEPEFLAPAFAAESAVYQSIRRDKSALIQAEAEGMLLKVKGLD